MKVHSNINRVYPLKSQKSQVIYIHKVKNDIYCMAISSSAIAKKVQPGQFLHIKIEGRGILLRRPFSVYKVDNPVVYILFKVRGVGTNILSCMKEGDYLDVLGPLGRGFRLPEEEQSNIILIAGGLGAAPLVFLAERIKEIKLSRYFSLMALLGAKDKYETLCEDDFKSSGCTVKVATEDGSRGFKGTVTDLLNNHLRAKSYNLQAHIYACGPEAMFRALFDILRRFPDIECEASFEQFMGCGIGICRGCMINSRMGYKRVCSDGPVFNLRDIY